MPNSDQRSKVTLEDLLRLKKTERPAADFWVNFERELRQKQLSALVEKRAWWHDLPQFFSRKIYLPVGATAILAFTLVSVKYYNPLPVAPQEGISTVSLPSVAVASEDSSTVSNPVVSSPLVNRSGQPVVAVVAEPEYSAPVAVAIARPTTETTARGMSSNSFSEDSPSARSIAANFARLEQSEPELINSVLGSRLSSTARVQNASAPVAELASLQINGSKRTRLLARYNDHQPNANPSASDSVRERLARRLGDNDFNDGLTRIGLKGDQFSLKF